MELQIHDVQISILRELLFKPEARFSELNVLHLPNDHFTFHLHRLVDEGLVIKKGTRYELTTPGKEFAGRMDTANLKLERQAKIGVALHPIKVVKGKIFHLVHKRLKNPFYGWYGSHSGKIRWGETPLECARRELLEETGLSGSFHLKSIEHYFHVHEDGRFLEDKYFWVFKVDNLKGKLISKTEEGENIWMSENQYRKLKHVFAAFDEVDKRMKSKSLEYLDRTEIVDEY